MKDYDEFYKRVNNLKLEYKNNPDETLKQMDGILNTLKQLGMKENTKKEIEKPENEKISLVEIIKEVIEKKGINTIYIAVFIILIVLLGFINSFENMFMYYFGVVFFIAGLLIGIFVPYGGVIFLFSHGATGLGIMLIPKVSAILKSPVLTDGNTLIIKFLILAVIAAIMGFILTSLYNFSEKFKKSKKSMPIILGLFLLAILIVQLVPVIFSIPIGALLS